MQRDYKFSSVFIIQVISAILIFLITLFLAGNTSDRGALVQTGGNILLNIIITSIIIIFQFIIARGLIFNRMGSLGEYFDNINHLNFKAFLLCFLILFIPSIVVFILAAGVVVSIMFTLASGGIGEAIKMGLGFLLIGGLFTLIYGALTNYQYFVVADNPYLVFGDLFKKTFKTGKDLFGKTVLTYVKWYVLPLIIFILIVYGIFSYGEGMLVFATMLVLAIAFILYVIISSTLVIGELSNNYLNYKAQTISKNENVC
ncbi:hypothetical protein ACCQ41_05645 [Anaerococcus sp. ENR0831]|uniref:DUF975 family protein n=1 Tax=Anaerococcus martiniensis TaxID=3115615 RepID=A0ABW9M962_9FIRM